MRGQAGRAVRQTREHGAGGVLEAPGRGGLDQGAGVDIDGGGDGGEIAFVGVGGVAEDVDAGGEGEVEAHGGYYTNDGWCPSGAMRNRLTVKNGQERMGIVSFVNGVEMG